MSELRRAAEAAIAMIQRLLATGFSEDDTAWDDAEKVVINLQAALAAAPDELAEAREIIEHLVDYAEEYSTDNGTRARDFLQRTEPK